MKSYNPSSTTLSIGDGGNDVSMIMEAHIGIGVYGEEGMRAVQASDFAIGEFKLLRRLLLVHGRTNNIRNSEMILYFFFKNFVFTIPHFFYGFYNKFSGQTVYDDWFISLYNMIFTAVPLGARAASDFDLLPDDGFVIDKMMPFLYNENRIFPKFTKLTFCLNLLRSFIFGAAVFILTILPLNESGIDSEGYTADLWFMSTNVFTIVIILVSLRIILVQRHFIWLIPFIMVITSLVTYIAFVIFVHGNMMFKSAATMNKVFGSLKFYLTTFLSVMACWIVDKFIHSYGILFTKSLAGTLMLQRYINSGNESKGKLDDITAMPRIVREKFKVYSEYDKVGICENNRIASFHMSNIKRSLSEEQVPISGGHLNGINGINGVKSNGISSNNLQGKNISRDLELMEAPYNKKVNLFYKRKMSELIEERMKEKLSSNNNNSNNESKAWEKFKR